MVSANNSINNTVGASISGVTNTLTLTNASNTANSQANMIVNVGGSTSGDPFATFTVTGVTSWSIGADNSASDAFVIAASTALGTTNVISMATGGAVSVVLGDLDVTRSSSGASVVSTISNTSNTASSNARMQVSVAGTSANDAFTTYTVTGTTNWSEGIDNSVTGDPFKISASTALGTTDTVVITTGGAMTRPLQPAFSVYPSGTLTDKTGDGTDYPIIFDTAFLNVGTCVNLTTGVFTAPVAGNYYFYLQVFLLQLGVAHTFAEPYLQIAGSLANIQQGCYNPATMRALSSNTNDLTLSVVLFQTLAASDTVTPHIIVGGSTKTVDLNGGTSGGTVFYGWLVS